MRAKETQTRRDELERIAASTGRSWADELRSRLRSDGGRDIGMWPGTLSEARTLFANALAKSSTPDPTEGEREELVRAVYASARRTWLRRRRELGQMDEGDD